MLDFFHLKPLNNGGTIRPAELPYLRRTLQQELSVVKRYYRKHYKKVESKNLFANLINCFPMLLHLDDYSFSRTIEDQAETFLRSFNIVSTMNHGKVQKKGVLLGPQTEEIVISVNNEDDFLGVEDRWWRLEPVTYLYHTRSDLGLPVLNNTTKGQGFGILAVNIPMLLVKYRYWVAYQKTLSEDIPSVFQFVGTFVLPDVVRSYFDIAVFNRMDLQTSETGVLRKYPSSHPFYLTDYSDRIDKMADAVIKRYQGQAPNLERAVFTPLIFKDSLLEIMKRPSGPVNLNNEWAYLLMMLPYYRFLIRTFVGERNKNTAFLNKLATSMRRLKHSTVFNQTGSTTLDKYIQDLLEDIRQLLIQQDYPV